MKSVHIVMLNHFASWLRTQWKMINERRNDWTNISGNPINWVRTGILENTIPSIDARVGPNVPRILRHNKVIHMKSQPLLRVKSDCLRRVTAVLIRILIIDGSILLLRAQRLVSAAPSN
jgi:hypothetical protein